MIFNITPSNRSFHERILNSFVKIKGRDFYDHRDTNYIIKFVDEKAVAGMCLYPSWLDNPVWDILQSIGIINKETQPEQGRWFISGITNETTNPLDKNKTLVMELFLSLLNFGLQNQISNFVCISKNNLQDVLTALGIPPLLLHPRVLKVDSGIIVSRIDVNYSALRFLEKVWNEEMTNVAH